MLEARGLARLALALLLAPLACAAPLENPEAFADRAPLASGGAGAAASTSAAGAPTAGNAALAGAATGGTATSGGAAAAATTSGGTATSGGAPPVGDVPACVAALLTTAESGKCSNGICHHAGADPAGGLDLASPGVKARLVDQPASHAGATPNSGCPMGDKLIDSANPMDSWLLKKLQLPASANCGAKMPLLGALTADELSCLTSWVESP